MNMSSYPELLRDLRAAAEPTRLRLLGVLSMGEFSVTDLTRILGQSQPRVSRHLKLLGEAGLLERFREQHWIFYRVPSEGTGGAFVSSVLGMLDGADRQLKSDRDRATEILESRRQEMIARGDAVSAVSQWERQALAGLLVEALAGGGSESLLVVSRTLAEPLEVLGPRTRRAVGLSSSLAEVRKARATLHGRGLSHCVLHHGDLRVLPASTGDFEVIVLDRVLDAGGEPETVLPEAARRLARNGRLLIVERYDALAERKAGSNPIDVMRDWLASAGLVCQRVKPVDLADTHLLLGVASGIAGDSAEAAA